MAESDSFHELLQCSICLERFTQPKMLPCQHTFCLNCLRGITKDAKTLDCPQCRERHPVPEKGMSAFSDNLMARNLLAILGDSVECHDCKKTKMLTQCEHCDQQVCGDCRVAHNVLRAEISILLQSIKEGVLHQVSDDEADRQHVLQTSLDQLENQEARLQEAFKEAVAALNERRDQLLRQLKITTRFHKALIENNEDRIIEQFQLELRKCETVESLQLLKGSLLDADKILSSVQTLRTGLEFSCDMSNVTEFGKFVCGEQKFFNLNSKRRTTPADGKVQEERSRDRPVGQAAAAGTRPVHRPVSRASAEAASNHPFPAHVDYQAKTTLSNMIVLKHPVTRPTYAEYSVFDNSIYCILSDSHAILVYDMACGGEEKFLSAPIKAQHLSISDSGEMLITNGRDVVRVDLNENDVNSNFLRVELFTNCATQVCCHGKEFAVLDNGEKSVKTFSEDGKFIREFSADKLVINENSRICVDREGRDGKFIREFSDGKLVINENSRMCVDREGRIYVTGILVDREDSESVYSGCRICRKPDTVTITMKSVIVVLSWEGEFIEEIKIDGWSEEYDYTFDEPDCDHSNDEEYYMRDEDSVPSDEQIIRKNSIGGICVDADGYISITKTGKKQINVYNPKRELHCTIGDPAKRPGEFKEPSGVNLMPDGRLIVCDTGNNRIQIV